MRRQVTLYTVSCDMKRNRWEYKEKYRQVREKLREWRTKRTMRSQWGVCRQRTDAESLGKELLKFLDGNRDWLLVVLAQAPESKTLRFSNRDEQVKFLCPGFFQICWVCPILCVSHGLGVTQAA